MTEMRKVPLDDLTVNYQTLTSLINTPTIPNRYRESPTGVQDMYAATLAGKELGIGWWTSIHEIFIVNGQASMQGKMMLALVWRAGHKVEIVIEETKSTVKCWRRMDGKLEHVGDISFDVEDADRAGLMDKGTYQQYPKTMLTWRAVSMACRLYYPDAILSLGHVPEEINIDAPMPKVPGYVYDDKGQLEVENAVIELETVLDAEVVVDLDDDGNVIGNTRESIED